MTCSSPGRTAREALGVGLCLILVAGCGGSGPSPPAPAPHRSRLVSCGTRGAPGTEPTQLSRLFSAGSVWNRPKAAGAPLGNQRFAQQLAHEAQREIAAGTGPWIETSEYSTPVYTVGPGQRCVQVHLDVKQSYGRTLSTAFERVPLPDNARPASGTDEQLTLIQLSTDSLWEFWHLRREGGQWRAAWGGAIHDVSASPGYYTKDSWPGARSYWGATATSLPIVAGTITIGELERGRIDHALAISIPNARSGAYAFPAQRTDGTLSTPHAIPEGTTFRLDPTLNLKSLHLPRVVEIMAEAAQRYGMIVRDKTLHSIGFYAEDPSPLGRNPYLRLFDGESPGALLKRFPWSDIQAVS